MTTGRCFAALLLCGGLSLAEEALRTYPDDEILRHVATFDRICEDKGIPEAEVVETVNELHAAHAYLKALERLTAEQARLREEILDRVAKRGLTATKRPIVNIHCALVLGEMGDPKGAAPLVAWLQGLLNNEPHPNPTAVEYGFRSLAWIGPGDKVTLEWVLGHATGDHGDASVTKAAIQACCEWRELDGETRKRFFDGICTFLSMRASNRDAAPTERSKAVEQEGLKALRELAGGKRRFTSAAEARAWFEGNTKWEPFKGPRFR